MQDTHIAPYKASHIPTHAHGFFTLNTLAGSPRTPPRLRAQEFQTHLGRVLGLSALGNLSAASSLEVGEEGTFPAKLNNGHAA